MDDWKYVLGYRAGNTLQTLKRKYRQLARRAHPDKDRRPGATARFQALLSAWERAELEMTGGVPIQPQPPQQPQPQRYADPPTRPYQSSFFRPGTTSSSYKVFGGSGAPPSRYRTGKSAPGPSPENAARQRAAAELAAREYERRQAEAVAARKAAEERAIAAARWKREYAQRQRNEATRARSEAWDANWRESQRRAAEADIFYGRTPAPTPVFTPPQMARRAGFARARGGVVKARRAGTQMARRSGVVPMNLG
jgi:hypothetical protein